MDYDLKEEYKKWIFEKEIEENLLRTLGVSEEIINELRKIDKKIFNSNRRFHRHERVSDTSTFSLITNKYCFKDMSKLEAVLDELENEIAYEIIFNADEETYKIVELIYQGYECTEIAEILGISKYRIYRKLKNLKKLF